MPTTYAAPNGQTIRLALYLLYTSSPAPPGGSFVAHFATNNEGVISGEEYSHIKASIPDINKRKESGQMTQGQ